MSRGPNGRPEAGRSQQPTDPAARAREICLRQLAARPHGRRELAGTLHRSGVADDVAEAVLDRLTEVGLIDDDAFAAMVVSSARAGRALGRRGLEHELRRRGVDPTVAADAIAVVDDDAEETAARALVTKRLPGLTALPAAVRARRLSALLARKGFSAELARTVLRDMLPDAEPDAEPDDEHPDDETGAWSDLAD
jgi:regulatory protein